MRRILVLSLSILSLLVFFTLFYLSVPQWFLSLDSRLHDFLFMMRGPIPASGKVLIIDIDENSLRKYGQWPWPRDIVSKMIGNLSDAGAGIIGMDIVFAEADRSVSPFPKNSGGGCPDANDRILAQTVSSSPVIGGYFFSFDFNTTTAAPSIPAVFIEKNRGNKKYILEGNGVTLNIPCVQKSFYSSGFFNIVPDAGGTIRHLPLVMRYQGILYPSLVMEMVRIYSGTDSVVIHNSPTGVDSIRLGRWKIPTDRFARLRINYRGQSRHFRYLSARKIIEKRFSPETVKGKFVLIGTSAIGLADIRPTPMDSAMPGVEILANAIDNIITGDIISSAHNKELLDLEILFAVVVGVALLFYLLPTWLIIPSIIALSYGMYRFFFFMFFIQKTDLNILMPVSAFFTTMSFVFILRSIFASQQEKRLKKAFARKVSPSVMHDILSGDSQTLFQSHNKTVSILFSDIRSFTTLSETVGKPEKVVEILNRYFTPMAEIIIARQGTIDKFIGDAIMAYWNAPTNIEDHADQALKSAIEQIKALKKVNEDFRRNDPEQYKKLLDVLNPLRISSYQPEDLDVIRIGIAIHTGIVTVGEMGSPGRSDYTIIGDNVNLTARLEDLCKYYGVKLIISRQTKESLTDTYPMRELDTIKVRGKLNAVTIYEVFTEQPSPKELELYNEALRLFKQKKFESAEKIFKSLLQKNACKLYTLYRDRCLEKREKEE